ncbi:ATP-binding protein [Terribacillus sp. DMT04]|uniref:ATP-binding protein n=1 Tax=Terribacillus sp. DMT04 TaxID=2850441 RepID=UPI001C2BBFB6|nr:ATP-binding protein [Terribacillus sp. DMT04]QXE01900.1 ATP-binding protein [Terribacillus sp. DMT04]
MKRYIIMTVGKTHSGKTTFAKELEEKLEHAVLIDQDNHASFLHDYYKKLVPKTAKKELKHAITQTVVNYAIERSNAHLIISNANLRVSSRTGLLQFYKDNGFTSIIVYFDLPDCLLRERIRKGNRSTTILRNAVSFEQVLDNQAEDLKSGLSSIPLEDESEHFFIIQDQGDKQLVLDRLTALITT